LKREDLCTDGIKKEEEIVKTALSKENKEGAWVLHDGRSSQSVYLSWREGG